MDGQEIATFVEKFDIPREVQYRIEDTGIRFVTALRT